MSKIHFANPPLIELITELRWNTPNSNTPPFSSAGIPSFAQPADSEESMIRFGGEVYSKGFQNIERLTPPNFPTFAGHVAIRFKRQDHSEKPVLYQVGPGIFTANATAPYKTWDDFSPIVRDGVEALLKTRSSSEHEEPFSSISVRYIDAFDDHFLGGQSSSEFISETLGFKISLPAALNEITETGKFPMPFLRLEIPITGGMYMALTVGEGIVADKKSVILDTTVITTSPTSAEIGAVMEKLLSARNVIHDVFIKISHKLSDKMKQEAAK